MNFVSYSFVVLFLDDLTTVDGSHLSGGSGRRFSERFLEELRGTLVRPAARTGQGQEMLRGDSAVRH